MPRRVNRWIWATPVFVLVLYLVARPRERWLEPLSPEQEIQRFELNGISLALATDGVIYRLDQQNRRCWHAQVFDPQLVLASYPTIDGVPHRAFPDAGLTLPIRNQWTETFEDLPSGLDGLRWMCGPERSGVLKQPSDRNGIRALSDNGVGVWSAITLQTPDYPDVNAYVRHRNQLMAGHAEFTDGRVEPIRAGALAGNGSLRCQVPSCTSNLVCAKASVSCQLVKFVRGDHVRVEATLQIDGSQRPFGLIDLECDLIALGPGLRLVIWDDGGLGAELKSLEKTIYRQRPQSLVLFPLGRPVRVVLELYLQADTTGHVRITQDGQVVIDESGPTLPFHQAIVNSLEAGITAHHSSAGPATLLLDNIAVSAHSSSDSNGGQK